LAHGREVVVVASVVASSLMGHICVNSMWGHYKQSKRKEKK
jgi:hypothetical protein